MDRQMDGWKYGLIDDEKGKMDDRQKRNEWMDDRWEKGKMDKQMDAWMMKKKRMKGGQMETARKKLKNEKEGRQEG